MRSSELHQVPCISEGDNALSNPCEPKLLNTVNTVIYGPHPTVGAVLRSNNRRPSVPSIPSGLKLNQEYEGEMSKGYTKPNPRGSIYSSDGDNITAQYPLTPHHRAYSSIDTARASIPQSSIDHSLGESSFTEVEQVIYSLTVSLTLVLTASECDKVVAYHI